jgi:hypothetical protein
MFRSFTLTTITWFALSGLFPVTAAGAPLEPQTSSSKIDLRVPSAHEIQRLTLTDGSTLYGSVESIADDSITFRTLADTVLTISRSNLRDLRVVSGHLVNGELRPRDPQQTRLFFGPTAKSLEHGDAYAGLYYFHVPFVQVGVTDRFSIGGGSPILVSLLTGEFGIWITPKLQVVSGDRVQMAIGSISTIGDGPDVGLFYGVSTIGGPDRSASIGLGYGYHGANGLVVMAGAEARTSRRVKWMTENWFTPDGKGVFGGGFRLLGERFSADVGLMLVVDRDEPHMSALPLPVFGVAWHF